MNEFDWSSEDVVNLRTFLETRTGNKLIPKIAESAPTLFGEGDTNKLLTRAGELRGYQSALRELFTLANPPPEIKQEQSPYPALEKDSEWADGQKLTSEINYAR